MSLDVPKAASAIENSMKKLAAQGLEEAKKPTAAGQLAFDDACETYITAVADIAKLVATQKRSREAINEILHRTVDTVA